MADSSDGRDHAAEAVHRAPTSRTKWGNQSRSTANAADGVVDLVDGLLNRAISKQASDVHFEPDADRMRVRFRLDGILHDADQVPGSLGENVVARLKVLGGLLTYRTDIPQEGSFRLAAGWPGESAVGSAAPLDVRVATFPTVRGERAVLRILYAVGQVSSLEELGLSSDVVVPLQQAAERPHGLILVTGPAGSGKTTTLYALARHILAVTPGRSVISLEDPVEKRLSGMTQIQVSPHGELDYVRAMRSLLRQDVQVLLVGEIRDAETAHHVVQASLTGHLVMSTMHSGDPAEAIGRLLEMGLAPYRVVGALTLVGSQRLLRTVCDSCRGRGCETCVGTGYRGRRACGQVVVIDDELRQAVLDRRPVGELRRMIGRAGSDLVTRAATMVAEGITTREEMARVLGVGVAGRNDE